MPPGRPWPSCPRRAGQLPALGYHRLGQHFTPILVLWMPLVGLLGRWALPLVQVSLMSAAGLVLFQLARQRLAPVPAAWIALSFFGANAVLGPTWGNFTDLCQLPLALFTLLLGLERRSAWLILPSALAIPLIREDTGVLLLGVALWLSVRQPHRWPIEVALALWGGGWVLLVTNTLMPLFSEDNARRFMVENFGQYIPGRQKASSLEILHRVLSQPGEVRYGNGMDSGDGHASRFATAARPSLGQGLPTAGVGSLAPRVDSGRAAAAGRSGSASSTHQLACGTRPASSAGSVRSRPRREAGALPIAGSAPRDPLNQPSDLRSHRSAAGMAAA